MTISTDAEYEAGVDTGTTLNLRLLRLLGYSEVHVVRVVDPEEGPCYKATVPGGPGGIADTMDRALEALFLSAVYWDHRRLLFRHRGHRD